MDFIYDDFVMFVKTKRSLKYKWILKSKKRLCFIYKLFLYVISNSDLGTAKLFFTKYFPVMIESKDFNNWRNRLTYLLKTHHSSIISKEKYISLYGKNLGTFKWNEYRSKIAMTLENQIKKYGEKEGTKRWNEYCNKQSLTNTFEYKNKKYGMSFEEFVQYNKSRAVTLENQIKKYGEKEGTERWNKYCELQKYAGSSLSYFIDKYGSDRGQYEYKKVNDKKAITLQNFINKYGEKEGTERFMSINWTSPNFYSQMSQDLFNSILPFLTEKCYYGTHNNEFKIYNKKLKCLYCYDFVIPSKKLCIEFNGNYWHANPQIYKIDEEIHYPKGVIETSENIWKRDKIKVDFLRSLGYNVLIIWENEYVSNKEETIKKCLAFINQ